MSKQLTSEQRYAIYLGLKRKQPKKSIAQEIGVHPSTITREVQRNSNRDNQYVFTVAQRKCESRKHTTLGNHRKDEALWWRVEQMIKDEDWSPRQISGVLAKEGIHIGHQTIYNHVHADTKGELAKHMPHELRYRRKEKKQYVTKATNIPNRTSIHDRPEEANGRRFGDWEMDLIVDGKQHVILTLVERSTNMLIMQRIPTGKKAEPIARAVVKQLFPYRGYIKTITTDNGSEFAAHQLITKGLYMLTLHKIAFVIGQYTQAAPPAPSLPLGGSPAARRRAPSVWGGCAALRATPTPPCLRGVFVGGCPWRRVLWVFVRGFCISVP